jgi:hypothetical protein
VVGGSRGEVGGASEGEAVKIYLYIHAFSYFHILYTVRNACNASVNPEPNMIACSQPAAPIFLGGHYAAK